MSPNHHCTFKPVFSYRFIYYVNVLIVYYEKLYYIMLKIQDTTGVNDSFEFVV